MKQLLILITTLASLTAQGQDTKPTQKILIGFSFSPDYSSRTLKNNDGSTSSDLVIKSRNDIEVAKFGYTTGLNVCFNFSQLVGFETGIQFSNKGYKTKSQDLIYFPPSPSSPTKAKTTYSYQYIGIPLKVKFSFGKSKVRFLSSIGFMTNLLLNVKQTNNFEYSNGKTENKTQSSTSGFKKFDISPMISVGIDYKLNNKVHLVAEPTFRYGVIKTKDAPVTEKLWNAGLNIGFYYALK
jgi:outer membrane protein with beta-barrel domain